MIKTTHDFQQQVLTAMTFSPHIMKNYMLYQNKSRPELGYFIKYSRAGYYDFSIGDYTICKDFSLSFTHNEELMRFGTVYTGSTEFQIENAPVSSFTPSSFFVAEKSISGTQTWRKGTHFHGAEVTIYKKYFDEVIKSLFPQAVDFNHFVRNHTYRYLPLSILGIIKNLQSKAESQTLTPLYLESKILETIALLYEELNASPNNIFANQLDYGTISLGKNRQIPLTASDMIALQKAYDILTEEACTPPTVQNLSKRVFLNEQKLKAGFSSKYHMSISDYTLSIRMAIAENLLATSEFTIEEISKQVGYHHSSNFVRMFKKFHGITPLSFRKMSQQAPSSPNPAARPFHS